MPSDLPTFQSLPQGAEPAVIALWQRCGSTRPWNPPEQDIAELRAHATADLLVAMRGDKVLASVAVGYDGHRGWVYYLTADPDFRGQGLGRAAMAAAEDWLRARGVHKLQLMVRDNNLQVMGFYQSLGYEDAKCRVMQKWIDPERERIFLETSDDF